MSERTEKKLATRLAALSGIHERLANAHPSLVRGLVWCHTCGRCESVNSAECLRSGWPKCCGCTMSLDAPRAGAR